MSLVGRTDVPKGGHRCHPKGDLGLVVVVVIMLLKRTRGLNECTYLDVF